MVRHSRPVRMWVYAILGAVIRYGSVSSDFSVNPRPPNEPGVYMFLGSDDRVMYVGMAHDLEKVLYRYKGLKGRQRMRDRLADGRFGRVAWLTCGHPETAPTLERILISTMRPLWNDQHNPRPRTPAKAVRLDEDQKGWVQDAESDLSALVARHARTL